MLLNQIKYAWRNTSSSFLSSRKCLTSGFSVFYILHSLHIYNQNYIWLCLCTVDCVFVNCMKWTLYVLNNLQVFLVNRMRTIHNSISRTDFLQRHKYREIVHIRGHINFISYMLNGTLFLEEQTPLSLVCIAKYL